MKIRIKARPGELEARAEDLVKAIRAIAGQGCCDELRKAESGDQQPRQLDHPALRESAKRARRNVELARVTMLRRIDEVLSKVR